jgi:hypothetical protein
MDWINLHTSFLDSPEFLGAEPVTRATWLCLLRYCVGQENGGRIAGADAWGDRKWQQLVRVTLREVRAESELWTWNGTDLHVFAYPFEKEQQVRAARLRAQENGTKGGRPAKPRLVISEEPTLVISEKAEGEGEGEGKDKRKRKDGEAPPEAAADAADFLTKPDPTSIPKRRYTIGDLQAICPTLVIFRDDRGQAETILALYGWDVLQGALAALVPIARKREPGKQRVTVSELAKWLDVNAVLEPDDYRRAGFTPPAQEA